MRFGWPSPSISDRGRCHGVTDEVFFRLINLIIKLIYKEIPTPHHRSLRTPNDASHHLRIPFAELPLEGNIIKLRNKIAK